MALKKKVVLSFFVKGQMSLTFIKAICYQNVVKYMTYQISTVIFLHYHCHFHEK